jgi:hypothetical protein
MEASMSDPKILPPTNAVVWESRVRGRFGIGRDAMRELRAKVLTEGEDWIDHGRVLLTPSAVKKCAAALGLPQDGPDVAAILLHVQPAPATPAPATAQGAPVKSAPTKNAEELLIFDPRCPNQHVLEAYKEGTDPMKLENRLVVTVRDNRQFAAFDRAGKPTRIRAHHVANHIYEHAP